ncbi:PAS domain S-box protein [Microvirga sp. VF16]|nr:PAS domain S-box protein [Microvirga sp. VF16]
MGALIGAYDWSKTSLGPISDWSPSLKSAVSLLLPAKAQIVLFWGPDFIALYNDAYAPTIGDKHPRALGRPARENWSELWDDLEPLLQSVLRTGETVFAKDRPFYIERHGAPEDVYFDISYSAVHDEAGAVAGVLCIVSETTERVLAQRALAKTQERLSHALSASGMIGTFDWHIPSDRFYSDARFATMFSVDPKKGEKGAPLADYLAGIHPDDRSRIADAVNQAIATGEKYIQDYRLLHRDGSIHWIEARGECLYDKAGKPIRFPGAVVDITERKQAEEVERWLAAIIESSDDAIISKNLNGIITSWNRGAELLFGYQAEEVIGRPITILIPEDRLEEEPKILERLRRGERVHHFETVRQRKDGSPVEISLTISPVRNAQGEVVGASKIARDITERKRAERLQQTLVHELNHRVKNTLATVQAIARQSFRTGPLDIGAREIFEARLQALSRAHDLLTRENWDGAEMAAVVAQVLAPYQRQRFEIGGPELRLTPRVALALSLALHELATNAAKYGALSVPTGRVAITWTVTPGDPPHLALRWQERGGPPVLPPAQKGFGSRLIERSLALELAGEVAITYDPAGVVCDVNAPIPTAWETDVEAA